MKPSAYISEAGVVFKEKPANILFALTPLYTSPEIQYWHSLVKDQDKKIFDLKTALEYANKTHKLRELSEDEIKEVYDQYFDLENFDWLHLQCIREILQKASEK